MRYMDANKILAKLKGETDRARTSLYLSRSIMEEFKSHCGAISPSRVMEDLMSEFIESHKSQENIKKNQITTEKDKIRQE